MARNFQSQPPAGRQMPANWASMAPLRAQQADDAYRYAIENAWRQPLQGHAGLMQNARLEHISPVPAPPKRNDARSDARFDAKMTLVSDNEDEQIWRDFNGATVVIKKFK